MKHCLRFCLLPLFLSLPISFFISKKAENIDNTIKDMCLMYKSHRINFMKRGHNMFGIVNEMQKSCINYTH